MKLKMTKVLLLNGPNLDIMGKRPSGHYGTATLEKLCEEATKVSKKLGIELSCYQSNHEGNLIEKIHESSGLYKGIIINAGAYTHTSVAIRDALEAYSGKVIEVHLSNIYAREEFRHKSFISPLADAVICGLKEQSYNVALHALSKLI